MFSDINLSQIENSQNFNFINKFDEDNEVFADNFHSCEYYEIEDMKNNFSKTDGFSTYSHNIRSINGHWEDVLDLIDSAQPMVMENLNIQLVIKMAPSTLIVEEELVFLLMRGIKITKC